MAKYKGALVAFTCMLQANFLVGANSELFNAIQSGNQQGLEMLLTHNPNVDVNAKNAEGLTSLMVAAGMGQYEAVQLLFASGAKIEVLDSKGRTALFHAIDGKNVAVLHLLLAYCPDLTAVDNYRDTPLSYAVRSESWEAIKVLMNSFSDIETLHRERDAALLSAANCGHGEVVRWLLDNGANIEAQDDEGKTALLWAAEEGYGEVVQLLLDREADIDAQDALGYTALLHAVIGDHADIAQLLLDGGADPEIRHGDNRTALHYAVVLGNFEMVQLLLDRGADIEAKDKEEYTALLHAADCVDLDIVRLLLDRGANIEAKNKDKGSALLYAADCGNVDIVRLLLDRRADIEEQEPGFCRTPLMCAVLGSHVDVVKLLLDRGANIEATDARGLTALMWSSFFPESLEVIRLLLDRGANINATARNGATACSFAVEKGHMRVARLLNARGAARGNVSQEVNIKDGEAFQVMLAIDEWDGDDIRGGCSAFIGQIGDSELREFVQLMVIAKQHELSNDDQQSAVGNLLMRCLYAELLGGEFKAYMKELAHDGRSSERKNYFSSRLNAEGSTRNGLKQALIDHIKQHGLGKLSGSIGKYATLLPQCQKLFTDLLISDRLRLLKAGRDESSLTAQQQVALQVLTQSRQEALKFRKRLRAKSADPQDTLSQKKQRKNEETKNSLLVRAAQAGDLSAVRRLLGQEPQQADGGAPGESAQDLDNLFAQ